MWGAIGAIGAGLLSYQATQNANSNNAKATQKANYQNYLAQKEFAQNTISWRKQDALNAGINPIYALGAQGAQFSPSFQAEQYQANTGLADALQNAGSELQNFFTAKKQLELKKEQIENELDKAKAESVLLSAQAGYYEALTERANKGLDSVGNSTGTSGKSGKVGTETQAAFTQYQQEKNQGVIDPNSQITQEQSSDGLGVIADLLFASRARAAQRGLELFNRGEMNYPYWERDPKENGRYVLREAGNFEQWLDKMGWAKSLDFSFDKFLNSLNEKEKQKTLEQLQIEFIANKLEYAATHFFD